MTTIERVREWVMDDNHDAGESFLHRLVNAEDLCAFFSKLPDTEADLRCCGNCCWRLSGLCDNKEGEHWQHQIEAEWVCSAWNNDGLVAEGRKIK